MEVLYERNPPSVITRCYFTLFSVKGSFEFVLRQVKISLQGAEICSAMSKNVHISASCETAGGAVFK